MKKLIIATGCSFLFGMVARLLTINAAQNEIAYREAIWFWCGIAAGTFAVIIMVLTDELFSNYKRD